MDVNEALALSPEEQQSLDSETKVAIAEAVWAQMNENDREYAVISAVLTALVGQADFPVVFKIMELAEADGMSVPADWRTMQEEWRAEEQALTALRILRGVDE